MEGGGGGEEHVHIHNAWALPMIIFFNLNLARGHDARLF